MICRYKEADDKDATLEKVLKIAFQARVYGMRCEDRCTDAQLGRSFESCQKKENGQTGTIGYTTEYIQRLSWTRGVCRLEHTR